MIAMEPGRFYLGMWAVTIPDHLSQFGQGGLTLIVASHPLDNPDSWRVEFHFRHYKDDKVFGSDDTRRGFQGDIKSTDRASIEQVMRKFVDHVKLIGSEELPTFRIEGERERMFELMEAGKGPPWMYGRFIKVERSARRKDAQENSDV